MDEWVTEERLDTRKVQYPRKDGLTTGTSGTGTSTPNRKAENISILSQSRPASPLSVPSSTQNNDPTVLSAALQKKISRKKKAIDTEVRVLEFMTYFLLYLCQTNLTNM